MKNSIFKKYMPIPYLYGGKYFDGCDCYGIIQLWYKMELNVDLSDFRRIGSTQYECGKEYLNGNSGVDFASVTDLQDHDVCILKSKMPHVGIYFNKHIIHMTSKMGVLVQSISEKERHIISRHRYKYAITVI